MRGNPVKFANKFIQLDLMSPDENCRFSVLDDARNASRDIDKNYLLAIKLSK